MHIPFKKDVFLQNYAAKEGGLESARLLFIVFENLSMGNKQDNNAGNAAGWGFFSPDICILFCVYEKRALPGKERLSLGGKLFQSSTFLILNIFLRTKLVTPLHFTTTIFICIRPFPQIVRSESAPIPGRR